MQQFKEQLRTYAALTASHSGQARVHFATAGIAASESGFVASAHTFKVHPDIDPASFSGPSLNTADIVPMEWTVGPTAGQYSRSLWRRVDRLSANFTEPVTLEVYFTLKDSWAQSFTHTQEVWEGWEYWVRRQLQEAPEGMRQGFQTADVRPPVDHHVFRHPCIFHIDQCRELCMLIMHVDGYRCPTADMNRPVQSRCGLMTRHHWL